jgi:hypothetical protein
LSVTIHALTRDQPSLAPLSLTLPSRPEIFHGRDDFVDQIVASILDGRETQRPVRVPILGGGGMGKTSVARVVTSHPDVIGISGGNRHWIPCDQAATIPLFLEALSRSFAVQRRTDNRLSHILSYLRAHAISRFIVLDNLETIWDPDSSHNGCEAIFQQLCSIPDTTLIVTMRGTTRPAGIRWNTLPVIKLLPLEAARLTLEDISAFVDDPLDNFSHY